MDVYELIYERGTIGALLYANKIENKNIRLASKIDSAVHEINRLAQIEGTDFNPQINIAPRRNTIEPIEPEETIVDKEFIDKYLDSQGATPEEKKEFFGIYGLAGLNIAKLVIGWQVLKYKINTNKILKIINDPKGLADENLNKLSKLFSELPENYRLPSSEPKYRLPFSGKSENVWSKEELLNKALAKIPDDTAKVGFLEKLQIENSLRQTPFSRGNKILYFGPESKKPTPAFHRDFFDKLLPNEVKALGGQAQVDALKMLPSSEVKIELSNIGNQSLTQKYDSKLMSEPGNLVKNVVEEGKISNSKVFQVLQSAKAAGGPLSGIATSLLEFLSKYGKFAGPTLGALSAVFDSKGIFDDWEKRGRKFDFELGCRLLGALSGVISTVAMFVPGAGTAFAAIGALISAVLSFGCQFAFQGNKNKEVARKDYSQKEVRDRMNTIRLNDLPKDDQNKLNDALLRAIDRKDTNYTETITQMIENNIFTNKIDVTALILKFRDEDPAILSGLPGFEKFKILSDAYKESEPKTSISQPENKQAPVAASAVFNLRSYRLANQF
jgi:hypothetical protein